MICKTQEIAAIKQLKSRSLFWWSWSVASRCVPRDCLSLHASHPCQGISREGNGIVRNMVNWSAGCPAVCQRALWPVHRAIQSTGGDGFLPVRQLSPRQWSAPMRHSSRTLSLLLAGRELPKSCEDIEWATGICNKTRRRSRLIIFIDTGNIKNNVLKVKLFSESYTLTSMHGKFLQLCSLYLSKTV